MHLKWKKITYEDFDCSRIPHHTDDDILGWVKKLYGYTDYTLSLHNTVWYVARLFTNYRYDELPRDLFFLRARYIGINHLHLILLMKKVKEEVDG